MKTFFFLCVVAIFTGLWPAQLPAADKKATPAEKSDKRPQYLPLQGKITAVDHKARTIMIGERSFHVLSTTKFVKAGRATTIDDAKVGEEVGGSYYKAEEGKLELNSLRIGPKPEKPAKEEKK